jgi:hypothetical protein
VSARNQSDSGVKLIAIMLIVGGAVGTVISLWGVGQFVRQAFVLIPWMLIIGAIFAWSAWIGVRLWQGMRPAYIWATILLIAQLPVVTAAGFVYHFYTGLNLAVILDLAQQSKFDFKFTLGALLQVGPSSGVEDIALGLNLVPLLALLYLWNVRWPSRRAAQING